MVQLIQSSNERGCAGPVTARRPDFLSHHGGEQETTELQLLAAFENPRPPTTREGRKGHDPTQTSAMPRPL